MEQWAHYGHQYLEVTSDGGNRMSGADSMVTLQEVSQSHQSTKHANIGDQHGCFKVD